ncbi:MAG: alpha/beta hydrolase [Phormidesmis sp.]
MWGLGIGAMQAAIALSPFCTKPTQAAERITFSLGATIERSISVESLEVYAAEGRVTEELAPYIAYAQNLDPQAAVRVRSLLSQRVDLDVITVAQFAYTPQGEYLLDQAGEVFRTGARLPGGQGLRGAAILAAADSDEGLTLLNVIRRFPTPVLRIDLPKGLAIAAETTDAFSQAQRAVDLISELSFEAASLPFPAGTSAASLDELISLPGLYSYRQFSLRVKASPTPVEVYLPQGIQRPQDVSDAAAFSSRGLPAVVISHGLGSDRDSYAYLSRFLAQHGFAVINLEHAGSSANQLDALVSGRTDQVVPDEEFINRPLLVSAVLDDLQNRALTDKSLSGINFNNVGIIGQSFGGYTALAVAGAPVDLELLRNACPPEFSVNISLLLQCQAVAILPEAGYAYALADQRSISFFDPRIQAVVAINPITSTILGPQSLAEIDLPVLMIAGSADTVAPALPEQVRPFTWLSPGTGDQLKDVITSDRYLLVMEGGTHFSTIGLSGRETFDLPSDVIGPVPEVAQRYTQVMSLAFLSTYLKGDNRYRPVLTSAFTTRYSDPAMPLSIVPSLSPNQLEAQIK